MDALVPAAPAAAAPPVPAARTAPQGVPDPVVVPPATHAAAAEPLPALPASVQRTQLEPPPAKLMTLEDMTKLLGLL